MKSTFAFLLIFSMASLAWALPVTDGLVLYLDAGDIQGIADGGELATWSDLSGAGNNATQSDSDSQPTYVAASEAFDGQPAVRFDGEASWMELDSSIINVGSFTLFAVANFSQLDTSQYIVGAQDGSGDDRLRIQADADITDAPFLWRAGSSSWKGITCESDTDIHVFGITSDVEGFLDGESVGTASNSSTENPTAFNIGSYNRGEKGFYDGDIAILVVYDQVLTDDEIEELSTYLMNQALSSGPLAVSNPNPANGADDIWLGDSSLSWSGTENSVGLSPRYRLSLADSYEDINDGVVTPVELDVNEWTLDTPLGYETTYYWRVDEANETTGWDLGSVWSFTTEPYAYAIDVNNITASATSSEGDSGPEKTIDESGLTDDLHDTESENMWISAEDDAGPVQIEYAFDRLYCLDQIWVWNSNQPYESILGFGVQEVMIEVSTDGETWTTLYESTTLDQEMGTGTVSVSTQIDCNEALATNVRLTCLSNWNQTGSTTQFSLSEVRFSHIPLYARLPQPEDGATDVEISQSLSWRPGRQAMAHEVYFSTDANEVLDGTAWAGQVESPNIDLSDQLTYNQTYYWRIDEANEAAQMSLYTGDLWSFSTPTSLLLEDFDDYDDQCNRIYWSWHDGASYDDNEDCGVEGYNGNGSSPSCYVGYYNSEDGTFGEKTIVYSGTQSMPFEYNNTESPYYSEATSADNLLASDWTAGGIDTLTLFIQGIPVDLVENSSSNLIISGAGEDIYSTADEFRFVYKELSDDGSIVARVASLENTDPWAKAGLMIRDDLEENAPNVLIYVSPENGVRLQQRTAYDDDSSSDSDTATDEQKAVTVPTWLKLEKSGSVINAYYATDEEGTDWVAASGSPQDISLLDGSVYIGLAVCSHSTNSTTVAEFTDITTTASGNWAVESIGISDAANSAEEIYVKITDSSNKSATVVHENSAATQMAPWTQWDIPLSEFSGVDLSKVKSLALGVGDGSSGGTGTIYVDELSLTRSAD